MKVQATDLLDGLEGYPAAELRRWFRESEKRLYVVRKSTDDVGSEHEPGTLRYGVEAAKTAGPGRLTWIVFDPAVFPPDKNVDISLREALEPGSNIIFDGRGAKVTLSSRLDIHLLKLQDTRNLVLRNLILHKVSAFSRNGFRKQLDFPVSARPWLDPDRPRLGVDADAFNVRGACGNLWVDHCTFFLCGDEVFGISRVAGPSNVDITISWCEFSDQYDIAAVGHAKVENRLDALIHLTFHHNLIHNAARRSPRVNHATADVYNNLYDGWVDWAIAANHQSKVLIEGNLFEPREGTPRLVVNIGTTKQPEGFVRTVGNAIVGGGTLDVNEPDRVEEPPYARSVQTADDGLRQTLDSGCGWQDLSVDFAGMTK